MEQQPPMKRSRLMEAASEHPRTEETIVDAPVTMEEPRKLAIPNVPRVTEYNKNTFFYERACYDEYYKLIENLVLEKKTRDLTVAGTSGIGNTMFYAYVFDRFRREHPAWWVIAASVWCTRLHGVAIYKGDGHDVQSDYYDLDGALSTARKEAHDARRDLVLLYDGAPGHSLHDTKVVFCTTDDKWIRAVRKLYSTYYMPLWTREELKEAARILDLWISKEPRTSTSPQKQCERDAEIDARFELFGGVAFYCLHGNPKMVTTATGWVHDEVKCIYDPRDLYLLLAGDAKLKRKTHNLLVHDDVDMAVDDSKMRHTTRFASTGVQKMLAEHVLAQCRLHRSMLHAQLRGLPHATSFCEWLETSE